MKLKISDAQAATSLRHAVKNCLGRDTGLSAVIRAVANGNLVLLGYTKRFAGTTECLFWAKDPRSGRENL